MSIELEQSYCLFCKGLLRQDEQLAHNTCIMAFAQQDYNKISLRKIKKHEYIELKKKSFKIGSLEFSTCDSNLLSDKIHVLAEISQWVTSKQWGRYRYVVAHWKFEMEYGYYLEFVFDRFLKVNKKNFFKLCILGQRELDNQYEKYLAKGR